MKQLRCWFTRRNLYRLSCVFAVITLTLLVAGCANWTGEAINIINQLVLAATGILALVSAFGAKIAPGDIDLIMKAGNELDNDLMNVVQPLITQYENAPDSEKANLLGQIETAITTVQKNWDAVFQSVHIKDPDTQARIEAVANLIAVELRNLVNLLPVLQGKMKLSDDHELPLRAKEFKKVFNVAFHQSSMGTSVHTEHLLG